MLEKEAIRLSFYFLRGRLHTNSARAAGKEWT
jgi:hypothetical protein